MGRLAGILGGGCRLGKNGDGRGRGVVADVDVAVWEGRRSTSVSKQAPTYTPPLVSQQSRQPASRPWPGQEGKAGRLAEAGRTQAGVAGRE